MNTQKYNVHKQNNCSLNIILTVFEMCISPYIKFLFLTIFISISDSQKNTNFSINRKLNFFTQIDFRSYKLIIFNNMDSPSLTQLCNNTTALYPPVYICNYRQFFSFAIFVNIQNFFVFFSYFRFLLNKQNILTQTSGKNVFSIHTKVVLNFII